MAVTNMDAAGVNTVEWLDRNVATIAVPVYQRDYRWDIDRCTVLLNDIRAVADADGGQTHFIGSILATADRGDPAALTLIDGQQRITTLTLLAAALHTTVPDGNPALRTALRRLLVPPLNHKRTTKLVPHKRWASNLAGIIFGTPAAQRTTTESQFEENYQFFVREVQGDWERVWRGLQRLEHVSITLRGNANPQQVFESLNSTGAPLKNYELVHNYILMGLSHAEQAKIEDEYWAEIEQNAGENMDEFLRHYLIQRTGRDSEFVGDHGVYGVFKKEFPRLTFESLARYATEWSEFAEIYRALLDPARVTDLELATRFRQINEFGSAMYPVVMAVYRDYRRNRVTRDVLLQTLEQLESLFLRKMIVGESGDHLAAQVCRQLLPSGYPISEIARRTPSDERVRNALKYRALPHPGYVLQRLQDVASLEGFEIEHIFPQTPANTWSGDGQREWASLTEEERARYRALLQTVGNLALLEQPLNAGASNMSFAEKKKYYLKSKIASTRALANGTTTTGGQEPSVWDLRAIEARTETLTEEFFRIWPTPDSGDGRDGPELVPILDVPKRPGYYRGWQTEFEYVRFRNETWEVRDVKNLYKSVFTRLWSTHRSQVLAYCTAMGKNRPIFETKEWNGKFDVLDGSHYLFMGYFPQYLLSHVQGVLDELGLADQVLVKYSPDRDDAN